MAYSSITPRIAILIPSFLIIVEDKKPSSTKFVPITGVPIWFFNELRVLGFIVIS